MKFKGSRTLPPLYILLQETTRESAQQKRGSNEEKGKLEIRDRGCRRLRKLSGISKRMFRNDSCATAPDRKATFQQEDQKPLERNLQRGEIGLD